MKRAWAHAGTAVLPAILAAAILLVGCATAPTKSGGADLRAPLDWPALFASYGSKPGENGGADRAKIESVFTSNNAACAGSAAETIESDTSTREQFSGAADAAGYLKSTSCLPALEAGLRNSDWFKRFACANAIDSIDSPSSGDAVIAALDAESHGMVAMALAMYLARHPSDEAQKNARTEKRRIRREKR